MIKYLWIGVLGFCLISCTREEIKTSSIDKIINRSNKDVFYFVDENIGKDSVRIPPHDSMSIQMEQMVINTVTLIADEVYPNNIKCIQIRLYNLTDTMSINRDRINKICVSDIVFKSHFNSKLEGIPYDLRYYNTTIIDDYLLKYLNKDYSMLGRFKEYYKK